MPPRARAAVAVCVLVALSGCSGATPHTASSTTTPPAPSATVSPGPLPGSSSQSPPPHTVDPLRSATAMVFVDRDHGFLGGPGAIWSTADGGRSWSRIWKGDRDVSSIEAVDPDHVWAVLRDRGSSWRTQLLLSVDAGRHWSSAATEHLAVATVSMVDDLDGWAVAPTQPPLTDFEPGVFAAGSVLRTVDGGRTWTDTGELAQAVCGASPTVAWAADRSSVLRTTDGGAKWSSRALYPPGWYDAAQIGCAGPDVAWDLAQGGASMSQQQYLAAVTADGGRTWTQLLHENYLPLPPGVPKTHAQIDAYSGPMDVVSASSAFFAGSCAPCPSVSVTGTSDRGRTFRHSTFDTKAHASLVPLALSFADDAHGWVLIGTPSGGRDELWRTVDGGRTWARARFGRQQPSDMTMVHVHVPSPGGVVAAFGDVWVQSGNDIWKVDPDGRVLDRFPGLTQTPGLAYMGLGGAGYRTLAAGAGSLWSMVGGKLLRIDPSDGRVLATIELPPHGHGSVAFGDGAVWVACCSSGAAHAVWRIDPTTDSVIGHVVTSASIASMAVGAGSVWVLAIGEVPYIQKVDPTGMRVVATFQGWTRGMVAAAGRWVWGMDHAGRGLSIERLDASTGHLTRFQLHGPLMAIAAWDDDLYVNGGTLSRVSGATGQVQRLAVGGRPTLANAGIAVTAGTEPGQVVVWMTEPGDQMLVGVPV